MITYIKTIKTNWKERYIVTFCASFIIYSNQHQYQQIQPISIHPSIHNSQIILALTNQLNNVEHGISRWLVASEASCWLGATRPGTWWRAQRAIFNKFNHSYHSYHSYHSHYHNYYNYYNHIINIMHSRTRLLVASVASTWLRKRTWWLVASAASPRLM